MNKRAYLEIKKKKRKYRRRRFFVLILFIGIIFILYKGVKSTSLFNLKNIEIRGNKKVEEKEIISKSNLKLGSNILFLRNSKIEENIKDIPLINNVVVKKKLPKTIEIEVTERIKRLQILTDRGYQSLDIFGYALEDSEKKIEELPEIVNLFNTKTPLGKNVFKNVDDSEFNDLFISLEKYSLFKYINKLDFESKDNIIITIYENKIIEFGKLKNVDYKVKLLNEVLIDLQEKGTQYERIKMNLGDDPVIILDGKVG